MLIFTFILGLVVGALIPVLSVYAKLLQEIIVDNTEDLRAKRKSSRSKVASRGRN